MTDTPLPALLAWSPDRPYTSRTTDWNMGCPLGYFAEFVPAAGNALATPLPNGVEGVQCRLVAGADATLLAAESLSWEDTLANLNAAILEGGGMNPLWWLLFAAIGLGVWASMGRPAVERHVAKHKRAHHGG